MKLFVQNTERGLVPLYPSDYDEKKKLLLGEQYLVDIKLLRDPVSLRRFMALIRMVHQNLPDDFPVKFADFTSLRREITMLAGFYETHVNIHGELYRVPESIAFENMDETRFQELYRRCLDVVMQYFLPLNEREIERELIHFL